MADHVYKSIELTGTSSEGVEAAVNGAIERASESLHNIRWFHVTEVRGDISDGKVTYWQVTLKVGFTLDDNPDS